MSFSRTKSTQKTRLGRGLPGLLLLLAASVPAAFAQLERVGPTATSNGYPAWYQDKSGLTLEFCQPLNQTELSGGWCLLLPPDIPTGATPEVMPTNFSEEHFYFAANSLIDFNLPGGGASRASLVLALEAAFGQGPVVAGDQVVFGRIRVRVNQLPFSGTYTVYHPYGKWTYENLVAGDRLFVTEDIGFTCPPGQFDCALLSNVAPFLLPSNIPGGAELPAIQGPVAGKLYIADPARIGPVTGSPLPPFATAQGVRNHNIFRVEGPNGFVIETVDFSLMGRIFSGAIPGRVKVDRASYTLAGSDKKVDVFATAFPTTQGRLPASPKPAATTPVLSFFNSACDVSSGTGALMAPAGAAKFQMFGAGHIYWGQSQPASIPEQVCVEDQTARNLSGQVVPAYFQTTVADEVTVTKAVYDPQDGSLSVNAASSDQVNDVTLTLGEYDVEIPSGSIQIPQLTAAPAKVRVVSSRGGIGELQVKTGTGSSAGGSVPVAINDTASTNEDSAVSINVVANDTLSGSPVPPGGAVVNIVSPPQLGTAVVNGGTVLYTPSPNASGSDTITYTLTAGTAVSSPASVAITIVPANDVPVAVNDSTSTTLGTPTTINVLANDTDLDGAADLKNAVNVTQPLAGASVTGGPGGLITFTATAIGTYTFTYRAQDQALATSANTATVTVTVNASENIVVSLAEFRRSQSRWRVTGTDSLVAGQRLTIAYANGTRRDGTPLAGTVIGTADVDAAGTFAFDLRNATGIFDPSSNNFGIRPTQIVVLSPLGGSRNATIAIR